jgi:glycosyltransferase involved in cell wall biosynthesis
MALSRSTPSVIHVAQPVDGGVARSVSDLVADQVARGWQIAVASPEGPLARRTAELGARHILWRATRSPGPASIVETARLARVVAGAAPTIVHLHSSKAGLAGRLAIRGRRPTVFQPHAWSFYALAGRARRAAAAWERFAARWTAVIVCVSEGEKSDGEAAGIRATWRVVPNGVDLEGFAVEDAASTRRRLGIGGGPLAVAIGRLSRQKGIDLLLAAWPEVERAVDNAQLVVIGSGPEEDRLRRRAGSARLIGALDDVRSWLSAADVVVVPSRWEGLAYVVLEAMAAGRPVVATDVAGMREALGDTGIVVPPEDPEALATALARALVRPDGAGARERVERLYDVRRATQAMADLYGEILSRR